MSYKSDATLRIDDLGGSFIVFYAVGAPKGSAYSAASVLRDLCDEVGAINGDMIKVTVEKVVPDFDAIIGFLNSKSPAGEEGGYCELDETETVVHFYRKDGKLWLSMPYEDYKAFMEWEPEKKDE